MKGLSTDIEGKKQRKTRKKEEQKKYKGQQTEHNSKQRAEQVASTPSM